MELTADKDCKSIITDSGTIREMLCKHGFYTEMKLNNLIDIIRNDSIFCNGLSTYSINPDHRFIELRFRNAFVKKNEDMEFYQNEHLNNLIFEWYKQYMPEISSILENRTIMAYNHNQAIMYYYLSKYQNTIVVNFI